MHVKMYFAVKVWKNRYKITEAAGMFVTALLRGTAQVQLAAHTNAPPQRSQQCLPPGPRRQSRAELYPRN